MLLIGGHALRFNGIDNGRKPLDIDVIANFTELGELTRTLKKQCRVSSVPLSANKTVLHCDDGRIVEVEIAWEDSSGHDLLLLSTSHEEEIPHLLGAYYPLQVASLDVLYMLKMSHRYLKNSPHFRKTRSDIMLMRQHGAQVRDEHWMKKREAETYVYKHPKLDVMKGDFFKGDGVQYVYDHDDIHKTVAQLSPYEINNLSGSFVDYFPRTYFAYDRLPAYELYKEPGHEVKCSKGRFFALPEHVRLYGVLEEAYVLALERSQIPFRGKVDPRRSFDMALMKVCTSITSGWFREFAWENMHTVESMYNPGYVDRFWRAVDDGIVRKLDKTDI